MVKITKYKGLFNTYKYVAFAIIVFSYNTCNAEDIRFKTWRFPEYHMVMNGFINVPDTIKTNTSIDVLQNMLETNNSIYAVSAARRIGELGVAESEKILMDYIVEKRSSESAIHWFVSTECYRQLITIGTETSYQELKKMFDSYNSNNVAYVDIEELKQILMKYKKDKWVYRFAFKLSNDKRFKSNRPLQGEIYELLWSAYIAQTNFLTETEKIQFLLEKSYEKALMGRGVTKVLSKCSSSNLHAVLKQYKELEPHGYNRTNSLYRNKIEGALRQKNRPEYASVAIFGNIPKKHVNKVSNEWNIAIIKPDAVKKKRLDTIIEEFPEILEEYKYNSPITSMYAAKVNINNLHKDIFYQPTLVTEYRGIYFFSGGRYWKDEKDFSSGIAVAKKGWSVFLWSKYDKKSIVRF